jgi:hypothetical protein
MEQLRDGYAAHQELLNIALCADFRDFCIQLPIVLASANLKAGLFAAAKHMRYCSDRNDGAGAILDFLRSAGFFTSQVLYVRLCCTAIHGLCQVCLYLFLWSRSLGSTAGEQGYCNKAWSKVFHWVFPSVV